MRLLPTSLSLLAVLLVASAVATLARGADERPGRDRDAVERGRYIVNAFGCNDCHTPLKLGPNGPEPDLERLLSGHPEDLELPPPPALEPGPWNTVVAGTLTAWSGPWGVSFTANLTPDPETGLGTWTEREFMTALRTGRHRGLGRQILPPMPWPATATMTDADLRAVFAYLRSLPPLRNRVPEPLPPVASR